MPVLISSYTLLLYLSTCLFIVGVYGLSTNETITCRSVLPPLPMNYNECQVVGLKTSLPRIARVLDRDEFESVCITHSKYKDAELVYHDASIFKHTLFINSSSSSTSSTSEATEAEVSYENENLHVFIIDFLRLQTSTVYIDLSNYVELTLNKAFLSYYENKRRRVPLTLVFHLVTRQFTTFQVLNVPTTNEYIGELLFLLNGEASLDVFEKYSTNLSRKPKVTVRHAPIYELFMSPEEANNASSNGHDIPVLKRSSWYDYLVDTLVNRGTDHYQKSTRLVYVEHLLQLCLVTHLRINLESLVIGNILDQVEYIRDDLVYVSIGMHDKPRIVSICSKPPPPLPAIVNPPSHDTIQKYEEPSIFADHRLDSDVYLFELSEADGHTNEMSSNYLRGFVKECDIHKHYVLIFYVNGMPRDVKITLDEYNCPVNIYSNVFIYDILNDIHPFYVNFNLTDFSLEKLKDHIVRHFKSFYYLEIKSEVNEIELTFIAANSYSMTSPQRFFNNLKHEIFYESNLENPSKFNSHAIKFTIFEKSIVDYFRHRYLNFDKILADETNHSDEPKIFADKKRFLIEKQFKLSYRYFFVTSKKCRAIYLNNETTPPDFNGVLIIFNSNLYDDKPTRSDNDCFYFDERTQTIYFTLAFNLEAYFTQTISFMLKYQINRKVSTDIVSNYYDQAMHFTDTTGYTLNGTMRLAPSSSKTYELEIDMYTYLIDAGLVWQLDSCSLIENYCSHGDTETSHLDDLIYDDADDHNDNGIGDSLDQSDENEGADYEYASLSGSGGDAPAYDFSSDIERPSPHVRKDRIAFKIVKQSTKHTKQTHGSLLNTFVHYSLSLQNLSSIYNGRLLTCSMKLFTSHVKTYRDSLNIKLLRFNSSQFEESKMHKINVSSEVSSNEFNCINRTRGAKIHNNHKKNRKSHTTKANAQDRIASADGTNASGSNWKDFLTRNKIPLILSMLLIASIIFTGFMLYIVLTRYFYFGRIRLFRSSRREYNGRHSQLVANNIGEHESLNRHHQHHDDDNNHISLLQNQQFIHNTSTKTSKL